jgi:hypothetical protein
MLHGGDGWRQQYCSPRRTQIACPQNLRWPRLVFRTSRARSAPIGRCIYWVASDHPVDVGMLNMVRCDGVLVLIRINLNRGRAWAATPAEARLSTPPVYLRVAHTTTPISAINPEIEYVNMHVQRTRNTKALAMEWIARVSDEAILVPQLACR